MTNQIDPVCGMTVDPTTATGQFEYDGANYYFCSKSCLDKFTNDPESFIKPKQKTEATMDDVE